jgi:3-oxoacyl-[acyl-carrier-protein] synthase II
MNAPEIAITGMGLVSSLGHDVEKAFGSLIAGESAIERIRNFDTRDLSSDWGAEIHEVPPLPSLGRGVKFLDRYLRLALGSIVPAVGNAGIDLDEQSGARVGIACGGWLPALNSIQQFIHTYDDDGVDAVSPISFPNCAFNAAASQAAIRLKFRGSNATLSAGGASGLAALEYAFQQICAGEADQMVVAAVQELGPMVLAGYARNGLLIPSDRNAREECAPFDRDRRGIVLGEVSCSLVIERLEHAERRGARVLAHVFSPYTGFVAAGCRVLPGARKDAAALAALLRSSLEVAALEAGDLDHVSAAANGCPFGDALEALALRSILTEHTSVGSIKGSFGELVGAAPLVQIAMCVQALKEGTIPPTLNFRSSDPGYALPGLCPEARRRPLHTALVSVLCWSGAAGGVVLRGSKDT